MDSIKLNVTDIFEYDVLVVGGGTTGCCAAIAAAQNGAKTALVEYYGFLGGNATCGLPWLGFHNASQDLIIKGIPLEIVERCRNTGGGTKFHFDPICKSAVGVNGTVLKAVLAEYTKEKNIDCYFHSLAIGVNKQGDNVDGVYISNKQGCQLIKAKVIIDCTDSGDVAVLAGAKYHFGREVDNKPQISSYIMTLTGIDFDEMISYFEEHPDQMRPFDYGNEVMLELIGRMKTSGIFVLGAFPDIIAKAKADGVNYDRDRLIGVAFPEWGELMLVASRVEGVNPNDVANFSNAELNGLVQYKGIMELIKGYIPGGKNARLSSSGHQIGIRETRHVEGDYCLTAEDLLSGKMFEDSVALGNYHLDIHSPDHSGLESKQPPTYSIPYRALMVKGLNNMLMAGRCISATHEAMSSTRVIPISAAQGQAVGTAAAIAVKSGKSIRSIDLEVLKDTLSKDNAVY